MDLQQCIHKKIEGCEECKNLTMNTTEQKKRKEKIERGAKDFAIRFYKVMKSLAK